MKKVILLSFIFPLWSTVWVNAQDIQNTRERKSLFTLQIAQSFGLNDWNRVKFASDRLPGNSSTDLRFTVNQYVIRKTAGLFHDISISFMPAPRNSFSDPASQAESYMGVPFYTKEVLIDDGHKTVSAHFKMTFGVFAKFSLSQKLFMTPCFGVGLMSITAPTYEAIIKEKDSNMQYTARYQWFGRVDDFSLGYLTYRLRFAYRISPRNNFLLGIEYTSHFPSADFSETYTNYFNPNIVRTSNYKGNQLNTLGVSVGISF